MSSSAMNWPNARTPKMRNFRAVGREAGFAGVTIFVPLDYMMVIILRSSYKVCNCDCGLPAVAKVPGAMESEMSAVVRPFDADLDEADSPATVPAKLRVAFVRWRVWFVSAVAALVALAGIGFILSPAASESTDDAYVAADATTVAPKIRGLVAEILVHDNQTVHAGDPLVKIDAEEFDAKLATAQADLADAEAGVATARAALVSLDAEERLANANVAAAQTAIRSSDA